MINAIHKTIKFNIETGETTCCTCSPLVVEEFNLKKVKEANVIGIYPSFTYQTFEGYGCALTETSCYLLSRMKPEIRKQALESWFGKNGINAHFVRIPIDSCDFALSEYQAVEDPIADPELHTFSIKRDLQYIIPIVKEAIELSDGQLSVMLSPWSPPAEWKTAPEMTENDQKVYGNMGFDVDTSKPGRCFGGRLKPEYYGSWAKYLVKFVQAYLSEGIPVTMLSVQNEANAATNWDSCVWSGEQEKTFLRDYLYPEMKAAGLTEHVGLYIWDHNKERMIEHIIDMMTPDMMDLVEGFAYHWYTGDHFDALSMIHEIFPNKILIHSESCGLHIPGKIYAYDFQLNDGMKSSLHYKTPLEADFGDAIKYAHDIIGDLSHGMQRWIDWNMMVDRRGGPRHVKGGFASPLVAEDDGTWSESISYVYLKEIAKTIPSGAVRIGSSIWNSKVDVTAVKNPDGSIGILLLNSNNEDFITTIRLDGVLMDIEIPANTLNTLLLTEE